MPRHTIITQLLGGLGNQMFQYAIGRHLAHKHDLELKVDASILLDHTSGRHRVNRALDLDVFQLEVGIATQDDRRWYNPHGLPMSQKILFHLRDKTVRSGAYRERSMRYDDALMRRATAPPYLSGLWQSYKYVDPIRELLVSDFSFREPLPREAGSLAESLGGPDAVCVNVRRGDFVSVPQTASTLGFIGTDYFRAAVALTEQAGGGHLKYYVFSDDPAWCRENLGWLPNEPEFVGHGYAGPKFSHYLQLMTLASRFIIPNSTFAWWAAWLSEAPDKTVIAPRRWFRDETLDSSDICPPGWTLA